MSFTQAWVYLLLAIVMEVAGTTCMKLAAGFSNLSPSLFIFLFYGAALGFLTLALRRLDVSFAYAIWSALGTVLIYFIGIGFFHESLTVLKTVSLSLIIVGVAGLKQE